MGGMEASEAGKQKTSSSTLSLKRRQEEQEPQQQQLDPAFKRPKAVASVSRSPLLCHNASTHDTEVDPLDLRWSILKQLLPKGTKAEKDDLLKAVFEYVQDLEFQIKIYKHEGFDITKNGASKEEIGSLQKKGLCIVPLSKLTTTF